MRRRHFHEYSLAVSTRSSQDRTKQALDFSRLSLCECGAEYLAWIQTHFPEIVGTKSKKYLDTALVSITKEYFHRRQIYGSNPHAYNTCLRGVFEAVGDEICQKIAELHRVPKRGQGDAELFIGQDPQER